MSVLHLTVNGRATEALVAPRTHLADHLREALNLTGTHLGCEQGACGACTLLLDDVPVRGCLVRAVECEGAAVRSIEGFDDDPLMAELRAAFTKYHALQCGYCTPGMLITARDMVQRLGEQPEKRVREELSGNLCRCTGYQGIVQAVMAVAAGRAPQAGAARAPRALAGLAAASTGLQGADMPGPAPAGVGEVRGFGEAGASATWRSTSPPGAAPVPSGGGVPARVGDIPFSDPARAKASVTGGAGVLPAGSPGVPPAGGPGVTETLTIDAPPDAVFAALADPRRVAACLPGAEITAWDGTRLEGRMRVALGPIKVAFAGVGEASSDPASRSGSLTGQGRDGGTGSGMSGSIAWNVAPHGAGSEVTMELRWRLSGALAGFSRGGLLRDLVGRMAREFGANLTREIAGQPALASAPPSVFALLFASLRGWIASRFNRRDGGP